MKKAVIWIDPDDKKPVQPKKCVSCYWGKWDKAKQVCSFPKCVKGKL